MAQTQALGTLEAATPPAMAAASPAAMRCRVCGSAAAAALGEVEFYCGFACRIYDCRDCGSRFTADAGSMHDALHAAPSSSYSLYRDMAAACKAYFDAGDLTKLRQYLSAQRKYKVVIDTIEAGGRRGRLLEVGCSRGHLTSYFILAGYDILATDISPHAIAAAEENFGSHFALAGAPAVAQRAPYDFIFHVGTIGCVADPVGFTQSLLDRLRPGGRLIFNAPNAAACALAGQVWLDEAFPPDLLTLFRKGFWTAQFGDRAEVVETEHPRMPQQSALLDLRRFFGTAWRAPEPLPLEAGVDDLRGGRAKPRNGAERFWHDAGRAVARLPQGLLRLFPEQPDPFGLFVTMTKR